MEHKSIEAYEVEQTDKFKKDMKRLVKKKNFNKLPTQIKSLITEFEGGQQEGTCIQISDIPVSHKVYKLRLPNFDTNDGKSNGYRVIYVVITEHKIIVLLTIYYKKEMESITDYDIKTLIEGYFMSYYEEED